MTRDLPHPGWTQNLIEASALRVAQEPQGDEAHERFMLGGSVTGHGGRSIFLGFVDPPLLAGELSQPAADLSEPARRLLDQVEGAQEIRIRGRAGTDPTLRIEGRPWLTDAGTLGPCELANVTSIEGGRAAGLLRKLVEGAGAGTDVIAELGIGFNSTITPRGHVMLDEKAARTAHVAIGRNTGSYGGDNEASIHVDCVFSEPAVEADGRAVELPA